MSDFCYEKNRVILPDKDSSELLTSDMVCDGDCGDCSGCGRLDCEGYTPSTDPNDSDYWGIEP